MPMADLWGRRVKRIDIYIRRTHIIYIYINVKRRCTHTHMRKQDKDNIFVGPNQLINWMHFALNCRQAPLSMALALRGIPSRQPC